MSQVHALQPSIRTLSDRHHSAVYLQVIGVSVTSSGALVIPFLTMSAISSTLTNYVASKYGHVRPLFMLGLAILPIGMVNFPTPMRNYTPFFYFWLTWPCNVGPDVDTG